MSAPSATSSSISRERLAEVARVLLVGGAIAAVGDLDVDRLAERAVEGRGVLGGVGEDRDVGVAGGVEGRADGGDLAVHHPRRGDHVDPGVGLRHGDLGVALERGVVVDPAVGSDDAAVAVVGVLVEAQVGHQHDLAAEAVTQIGEGELHDAVGVGRARADGVLPVGDAEQDEAGDAEVDELGDLLHERVAGVLDDARQRGDGLGGVDALPHEQGCDQVVDRQPGLGHEPPHGRRGAQAAGAMRREGHGRDVTGGRRATHSAPALPTAPAAEQRALLYVCGTSERAVPPAMAQVRRRRTQTSAPPAAATTTTTTMTTGRTHPLELSSSAAAAVSSSSVGTVVVGASVVVVGAAVVVVASGLSTSTKATSCSRPGASAGTSSIVAAGSEPAARISRRGAGNSPLGSPSIRRERLAVGTLLHGREDQQLPDGAGNGERDRELTGLVGGKRTARPFDDGATFGVGRRGRRPPLDDPADGARDIGADAHLHRRRLTTAMGRTQLDRRLLPGGDGDEVGLGVCRRPGGDDAEHREGGENQREQTHHLIVVATAGCDPAGDRRAAAEPGR